MHFFIFPRYLKNLKFAKFASLRQHQTVSSRQRIYAAVSRIFQRCLNGTIKRFSSTIIPLRNLSSSTSVTGSKLLNRSFPTPSLPTVWKLPLTVCLMTHPNQEARVILSSGISCLRTMHGTTRYVVVYFLILS